MKSKVIVSGRINCPQSVLMSICSPCEIVQSVSQLAEGVKKRNKMMERKNERKIEERISWRQTSRILYTFPSLTPYVDFSNSFVHTHTHIHTHTLVHTLYLICATLCRLATTIATITSIAAVGLLFFSQFCCCC